jgi:hypothetical protein
LPLAVSISPREADTALTALAGVQAWQRYLGLRARTCARARDCARACACACALRSISVSLAKSIRYNLSLGKPGWQAWRPAVPAAWDPPHARPTACHDQGGAVAGPQGCLAPFPPGQHRDHRCLAISKPLPPSRARSLAHALARSLARALLTGCFFCLFCSRKLCVQRELLARAAF